MEQVRILLIRHGETAWNAEKRLQGQTDITLDTAGLAQAEAAARWLSGQPVAAIYSSDLQRAQQTAAGIAVALGLSPVLLPAMRERRYGLFEGLTYTEARSRHPALYHSFEMREPDFALPEGGESLRQLHQRVTAGLAEIVDRHPGQLVVLVTHGGVLDIVNRFVRGTPLELPRDFLIPNAGINNITYCKGRWELESWAETAHLSAVSLDELP